VGYAYCVAAPSGTSSSAPSSTSSAPTPGPTQEGIASGCSAYQTVVSGDTCYDIATSNGITTEQFYAWNPPVGTDCSGLWLGYSYCVAGGPSSGGAPRQEGIPDTCTTYHTVVAGDTCYDIAAANGISLSQFYAWNPPVGTDCSGLWTGYEYCVAGGPSP